MNAKRFLTAVSAIALLAATAARAEEDTGVQLGIRTGFILPFGNILGDNGGGSSSYSDSFTGFIPIELEAGYRLNPNLMVGAFFQFGLGLTKNCSSGASCSGNDISFGLEGHYHFAPKEALDPWGGVGIGYEILSVSQSQGGSSTDGSFSGFQFLKLEGGVDFPLAPNFKIAPFASLALGTYSSVSIGGQSASNVNTAMHELLTIGVRGSFNL